MIVGRNRVSKVDLGDQAQIFGSETRFLELAIANFCNGSLRLL